MANLLDLNSGDKALKTSARFGYQTTTLAAVTGYAFTIEFIPELQVEVSDQLAAFAYGNISCR
jgi:protein-L-isoaspartate O-methyltransferase